MSVGQSTAGVLVEYGLAATATTAPTTWTEIPNVTGYPDLFSDPNTADVTPLSETKMVINIPLLMDIGILSFPAVMTPELVEVIAEIIDNQEDTESVTPVSWFRLKFPAPLAMNYTAPCEFEDVYPTGTDANNAITCTVRLTPKAAPTRADNV